MNGFWGKLISYKPYILHIHEMEAHGPGCFLVLERTSQQETLSNTALKVMPVNILVSSSATYFLRASVNLNSCCKFFIMFSLLYTSPWLSVAAGSVVMAAVTGLIAFYTATCSITDVFCYVTSIFYLFILFYLCYFCPGFETSVINNIMIKRILETSDYYGIRVYSLFLGDSITVFIFIIRLLNAISRCFLHLTQCPFHSYSFVLSFLLFFFLNFIRCNIR